VFARIAALALLLLGVLTFAAMALVGLAPHPSVPLEVAAWSFPVALGGLGVAFAGALLLVPRPRPT